jgi:hypothetical protein
MRIDSVPTIAPKHIDRAELEVGLKRNRSLVVLRKLAKALDVPVADLLG